MPTDDDPVAPAASRMGEFGGGVRHRLGEGVGEAVDVGGLNESDLGLDSEGEQPAALHVGSGLHSTDVAEGLTGHRDEVLGGEPVPRSHPPLRPTDHAGIDDVRRSVGSEHPLYAPAPLSLLDEFEQSGVLQHPHVVVDLLSRQTQLRGKLRGRCRFLEEAQKLPSEWGEGRP